MEDEDQEVLSHLHQMVKNIDPMIKSSTTLDNVEESLEHLEETDENFHKYDFVQFIRNQIEASLGSKIDEEIEKNSIGTNTMTGQETLVQMVGDTVLNSEKYSDLVEKLENLTVGACETLVQGIEDEQASNMEEEDMQSHRKFHSVFSEGASTCESSFNQGMFFMSQQQFHKIAEDLNSRQPIAIRREALKHLCQIPPSDVMASESWEHLRISLMDALSDVDTAIAHDALSFHARMFAVSNNNIMRETYTCLAEHLQNLFHSNKMENSLNCSKGVDILKPEIISILKRIRLVNEFQREVPSIWVRYPEYFLDKIIESTLNIVALKPKFATRHVLTPLHFISLIDPKANWFRKWLHGNYSRSVVLKQLESTHRKVLIDAVMSCQNFCVEYRKMTKQSINPQTARHDDGAKRTIYSSSELQYIIFIHSLCVISRLLLYSGGRSLFPVFISATEEDVTIEDLLILWIKVLDHAKLKPKPGHKAYEPAYLVGKMLRCLFSHNAFVEKCVNQDVISTLLAPVQTWLQNHSSSKQNKPRASEHTLLHVSEILSCLSSTPSGRHKIMFASSDKRKISGAAHIIAEFAQKCLAGKLPGTGNHRFPTYSVTGSFVFICRQMYNTCSGLLLLNGYKLHSYIANAWKVVHHQHAEISTVDTFEEKPPSLSSSHNLMLWEENLMDNLLNFAATPKGLLLLQQTGAINECVTHMFSRYTKKLQVSKCEKFGYGVMVTQIAATSSGIKALQNAGFESAVVHELWSALECTLEDTHSPVPLRRPVLPAERTVQKAFFALVNLLSAYPAVYEVLLNQKLQNKPSYTFREYPSSTVDILDRGVFVNSETKVHSLFNYEHTHLIGLRLLNVLVCSLDTLVLLESQYNLQHSLLQMQKDNKAFEGEIIIDELSVERNHILVRSEIVGGPSERTLPPRTVPFVDTTAHHSSTKLLWPWPMFDHFPVPKDYTISSNKGTSKKENALSRFLTKTKTVDKNRSWLEQCRNALLKVLSVSSKNFRINSLAELLEKAVTALERMPEEHVFPKIQMKGNNTQKSSSNMNKIAVKLTVQYGKSLNCIKSNSDVSSDQLTTLLNNVSNFLEQQQSHSNNNDLKSQKKGYYGQDWFVNTVFIIMGGNKERALSFLQKFSEFLCSGFLWPARLHASIYLPQEVRESGMPVTFTCTGHYVELILQNELPLIYSAFRMSGYTPSQICNHWLNQIFWNYLDWPQICQYITIVLIMGADYQIYFCLSIFKHMKDLILIHRQKHNLQAFLREEPIKDFNVAKYLDFMGSLEKTYRSMVLPDMRNILEKRK